jgi:GNAT superfamily N-acetyltransferase
VTAPLIRPGTVDDAGAVLAVLDAAVRWMVARGNTDQWGTRPLSSLPRYVALAPEWAASGGLYVATAGATVVAALVVGDAPDTVPAPAGPELYIRLLVTDHSPAARGAGARLLDRAREEARARGAGLLRVDCYAGNDGELVRYYERQGFTRTATFTVDRPEGPWPGQILEQRLPS